jgi:hypothetical protein
MTPKSLYKKPFDQAKILLCEVYKIFVYFNFFPGGGGVVTEKYLLFWITKKQNHFL